MYKRFRKSNKRVACHATPTNECKYKNVGNRPVEKMLKQNTAITLIALVITIIILLILAAVTLNIVLGENGIFSKAENAKEETEYSTALEEINLIILQAQTEAASKGKAANLKDVVEELKKDTRYTYIINTAKQISIIDQINGDITSENDITGETEKIYVIHKGYEFEIGNDLKVISNKKQNNVENESIESKIKRIIQTENIENWIQALNNENIENNRENLTKLINNNQITSYMIETESILNAIINNKFAMEEFGKSSSVYENTMNNKDLFDKMTSSAYFKDFDSNPKKISKLQSNEDKGFKLQGEAHGSYPLWQAFDENTTTYWLTPSYGDGTIYIEFPSDAKVYHIYYYIDGTFRGNYTPTKCKVYGIDSNEVEHEITDQVLSNYEKDIYFYNNNSYKKYKILFTQGVQAAGASILGVYYND